MTHTRLSLQLSSIYKPLQVGKALNEDLGYIGDNTGNHISMLNQYYGELTGQYWVAKNAANSIYTGLCHYRRFFLNNENSIMNKDEYLSLLKCHDILIPKALKFPKSYYDTYKESHNINDLDAIGLAIKKKCPEAFASFCRIINGNEIHSSNMFVSSTALFKEYTEWLFSIFDVAKEHIHPDNYDNYHRRVYGFLSEQLNYVWIQYKKLDFCEVNYGITQEKAETLSLKELLKQEIKKRDEACGSRALSIFREHLNKRPDLMLSGSDLSGDLEDIFRVIYILSQEQEQDSKNSMLWISDDLDILLKHYRLIRSIKLHLQSGETNPEELRYYQDAKVSSCMEAQINQMLS